MATTKEFVQLTPTSLGDYYGRLADWFERKAGRPLPARKAVLGISTTGLRSDDVVFGGTVRYPADEKFSYAFNWGSTGVGPADFQTRLMATAAAVGWDLADYSPGTSLAAAVQSITRVSGEDTRVAWHQFVTLLTVILNQGPSQLLIGHSLHTFDLPKIELTHEITRDRIELPLTWRWDNVVSLGLLCKAVQLNIDLDTVDIPSGEEEQSLQLLFQDLQELPVKGVKYSMPYILDAFGIRVEDGDGLMPFETTAERVIRVLDAAKIPTA